MTKSKCFLLFKTQLKNEFGRNQKSRGRTLTTFAIAITAIIVIIYSGMLSYGLGSIGMAEVIPSYGIAITGLIILFFTAFKTNGVLFAYKEYDLIMAFPVKTSTIIASRFLTMYALNLLLTAMVLIPMGIGYIIWMAPGFWFYPGWILGILAAPLVPTTFAAILGSLIIIFSSRFKYANAVVTIVSLLATFAVMILSVSLGGMSDKIDFHGLSSISEMMLSQIHRIYPPALLFFLGIVKGNGAFLAVFLFGSLLWYYLFIKLLAPIYKKLNTSLVTSHSRSDYKLTTIKASSQTNALLRKELKRFFSSTIYCLNMGMGSIMVIILSAGCCFVSQEYFENMTGIPHMWELLQRALPLVISALISMTCTTCVSLSLEGKNLWIIKSMPIDDITIYKSKLLMNLTLQVPVVILAAIIINFRFPLTLLMRILAFVTPLTFALFSSLWGLFINVKMPDYSWSSETALIKQSLPSMAGILGGLAGGFIPVVLVLILHQIDAGLITTAITFLAALGAFVLWKQIKHSKI